MTNYYLTGFKQGFQPGQKTATRVYQEIIKRQPDFLKKQIPASTPKAQIKQLGQAEGDFLSSEITVANNEIVFSELAQELLFAKKPSVKAKTRQKAFQTILEPFKTTKIVKSEPEAANTKGDDEEWQL